MTREIPDLTGIVQSLAAPDFISGERSPKFTFSILSGKDYLTLSADLNEPGAHAIVPIVCAAFTAGVVIDVFLRKIDPKYVTWVQVPKPTIAD